MPNLPASLACNANKVWRARHDVKCSLSTSLWGHTGWASHAMERISPATVLQWHHDGIVQREVVDVSINSFFKTQPKCTSWHLSMCFPMYGESLLQMQLTTCAWCRFADGAPYLIPAFIANQRHSQSASSMPIGICAKAAIGISVWNGISFPRSSAESWWSQ